MLKFSQELKKTIIVFFYFFNEKLASIIQAPPLEVYLTIPPVCSNVERLGVVMKVLFFSAGNLRKRNCLSKVLEE